MNGSKEQFAQPSFTLCQKYGFDQEAILHRLQELNLTDVDSDIAAGVMRQVVKPHASQIMDEFYRFILGQQYMQPFIGDEKNISRLKKTQTEYLLSLGIDFGSFDYFEHRLRIGVAHARIGMPLNIYLAAYSKMQCLLHIAIHNAKIKDSDLAMSYHQFLNKIIFLDMSLATDAYAFSTINSLSESVDRLSKEKDQLSNQLMHDTLTGSLSRAYILDVLNKLTSKYSRTKTQKVSVALLDIDHFKTINDTYGHQVGDAILVKFIETINLAIREHDYIGRYGGEEFLFVVTDTSPDRLLSLVERIRLSVDSNTYRIDEHEIKMTISIGLTHIRAGDDSKSLIQRADEALYEAKNSGRNQTVEYK